MSLSFKVHQIKDASLRQKVTIRPVLRLIEKIPQPVLQLCRYLDQHGARAWLVGGCVRDLYLDITPKDFDLEIYGLNMQQLEQCLQPLGFCQQVGKSFAVLKFFYQGMVLDIALPRTEKKTGTGHRAFEVQVNACLSPKIASQRRDFTMNAMMFDPLAVEFMDEHHGREALNNGVLRHVSAAFAEDPLRVLRGMQFAARFKLTLDASTALLCQKLFSEAASLSRERIWAEWEKWAKAPYPAYGLQFLKDATWWRLYPELQALDQCPQDKQWHPEGNVWIHTCLVVEQATLICQRNDWQGQQRLTLVFAALCHDLGKPTSTQVDQNQRIRSHGHAQAGVAVSKSFLKKIAAPKWLFEHISPLVAQHLSFHGADISDKAIRHLAVRLQPANIELWEALVEADHSGRPPLQKSRPALTWLQTAQSLHHAKDKPAMIITGKILIECGMSAGPLMGQALRKAYEAQLDGAFEDVKQARLWLREEMESFL